MEKDQDVGTPRPQYSYRRSLLTLDETSNYMNHLFGKSWDSEDWELFVPFNQKRDMNLKSSDPNSMGVCSTIVCAWLLMCLQQLKDSYLVAHESQADFMEILISNRKELGLLHQSATAEAECHEQQALATRKLIATTDRDFNDRIKYYGSLVQKYSSFANEPDPSWYIKGKNNLFRTKRSIYDDHDRVTAFLPGGSWNNMRLKKHEVRQWELLGLEPDLNRTANIYYDRISASQSIIYLDGAYFCDTYIGEVGHAVGVILLSSKTTLVFEPNYGVFGGKFSIISTPIWVRLADSTMNTFRIMPVKTIL